MAGHTPWKEIKRKRVERHKARARDAVEFWLKDCIESGRTIPDMGTSQTKLLLHQIEVGVSRGEEYVRNERNNG